MSKAWLVAVDMGYGHQRPAFSLLKIANNNEVMVANNYDGIPDSDKKIWKRSESFYYFISRFKEEGGFLGRVAFALFDYFQKIYPITERIQSAPTFEMRGIHSLIRKGWGKDLIDKLAKNPLPLVSTFFTVAHMAEYWQYPGNIYLLATDSDISRDWAPFSPHESKINYFAPTETAALHLERYGIPKNKIFLTGFPLSETLVLSAEKDFKRRMENLSSKDGLISLVFTVGGAGAQTKIGLSLIKNFPKTNGKIKLILVSGTNKKTDQAFRSALEKTKMPEDLKKKVSIVFSETKADYFKTFNEVIKNADILWTKPSELSFYAALGLPILMADPIGSQEVRNRDWLLKLGAGVDQLDPKNYHLWIIDFLKKEIFKKAAEAGFNKMERMGAQNIEKIISGN